MKLPDNLWKSRAILSRLSKEAAFDNPGLAHYWFAVPEADTKVDLIELRNFEPSIFHIDPHPHQKGMAIEMMMELNRHIDHDGLWIVGWNRPPAGWESIKVDGDNCWSQMIMIWLDEDGDIKFPLTTELSIVEIVSSGIEYYVELCERAWQSWNENYGKRAMKSEFGIKDDQLSKVALSTIN